MEFIEYYYLIRQRIWIVVLAVTTVVVLVVVRQLMPPATYQAVGRLQIGEAGKNLLVLSGGRLDMRERQHFWQGFSTWIGSREVLDQAAMRAGITGPDLLARLRPLEATQPTAGNIIEVVGAAPTAEQAEGLTQQAMEYVSERWNMDRVALATEIRDRLAEWRKERERDQTAARKRFDELRGSGLSPTEELVRAQGDLALTKSQVEETERDVALARHRLRTVQELAAAERARPPSQRLLTPVAESPLEREVEQLRVQLALELARRTPDHPEVVDLKRQLERLEAALAASNQGTEAGAGAEVEAGPPSDLTRESLDARIGLEEATERLALLQGRADVLRRGLPLLREQADAFQAAERELQSATEALTSIDLQLETVDSELARLAGQLEASPEGAEGSVRDVAILDEAKVVRTPTSRRKFALLIFAAILGGGLLSFLVILGLHYTSVTFANELEARTMLRRRILGGIPRSDLPADQAGPPIQVQ